MIKVYKGAYKDKELLGEFHTLKEAFKFAIKQCDKGYTRVFPLNGMLNIDNTGDGSINYCIESDDESYTKIPDGLFGWGDRVV